MLSEFSAAGSYSREQLQQFNSFNCCHCWHCQRIGKGQNHCHHHQTICHWCRSVSNMELSDGHHEWCLWCMDGWIVKKTNHFCSIQSQIIKSRRHKKWVPNMDEAEDSTSTVSLLENTSRIGQVAWIRPWFTRHAPCPNTTLNKKEQNRIKPCTCHLTRILNAIPRKQKKHAFRFEIESWEFYFIILYIIIESLNHIYNKFILYFIFTLVSLFYSIRFYSIFLLLDLLEISVLLTTHSSFSSLSPLRL